MKKTVSIHLAHQLFVIEEDAYDMLHAYIEDIKKRIGGEGEEIDEIIFDIESGIAEKFLAYRNPHSQAISIADVRRVMNEMGDASVFEEKEGEETKKPHQGNGFGKRFYRNPDDSIITGVCSGIAAYFGVDPLLIRILFVLGIIAWGSTFFFYLILAVIMPSAKTPAQKMEMRGDDFTLENIEKFAKEKAEEVTHTVKKTKLRKILEIPVRILGACVSFLKRIVPFFGTIIGICIMTFIFLFAVCVTIATVSVGVQGHEIFILPHISLFSLFFGWGLYGALALAYIVVFVPLLFFWFLGSVLVKRKKVCGGRSLALLLGIWFLGIVGAGVMCASVVPDVIKKQENYANAVKEFPVEDFSNIYAEGTVSIRIEKGDSHILRVRGNEGELSCIKTEVKDGVLSIKNDCEPKSCLLCRGNRVYIEITNPTLDEVVTKNGARVSIFGIASEKLSLETFDDSNIYVSEHEIKSIIATAHQSSVIDIEGSVRSAELYAKNYASITFEKFENIKKLITEALDDSRIELSGDGSEVFMTAKNNADIYAEELRIKKGTIETKGEARVRVYEKNVYAINEQNQGSVKEREKSELQMYEDDESVRNIVQ